MNPYEVTTPARSRWDQEDAEYVRSDSAWVERCARRMVQADGFLLLDQALGMALELSSGSQVRARSPESVAEELLRVADIGLN